MHDVTLFTGIAGSGKDTAGELLKKAYPDQKWIHLSFAHPVRSAILAIDPWILDQDGELVRLSVVVSRLGWDEAKKIPEVRRLLQKTGVEAGRNIHGPDCWVDILSRNLIQRGENTKVIITDGRFTNEAFRVSEYWKALIIEIRGPQRRQTTTEASGHSSELGIDRKLIHHIIWNTGTLDDLQRHVVAAYEAPRPDKIVIHNSPK